MRNLVTALTYSQIHGGSNSRNREWKKSKFWRSPAVPLGCKSHKFDTQKNRRQSHLQAFRKNVAAILIKLWQRFTYVVKSGSDSHSEHFQI